jgi:hypothetical protein
VSGRLWHVGNVVGALDATEAALRGRVSGRLSHFGTVVVDPDVTGMATFVLRERS